MALGDITQTQYVDYITSYGGKMDHFEQRGSDYAALRAFQAESNPKDPESIITQRLYDNVKQSFGIAVKEPVLERFAPTIQTSRSCAVATDAATSQLVTLVFSTYRLSMLMAPNDSFNNYVDYQTLWRKQFDGILQVFAETLDQDCVDVLELNKNTYWDNVGGASGFYTETADVLQVPYATRNDFYNQLAAIYQTMDYRANAVKVVSSPRHTPLVRYYSNQGSGNSINTGYQFGPYQLFATNRVEDTASVGSTVYTFPKGSVGMMSRLDPDSERMSRINDGDFWDVMRGVPLINQKVGVALNPDMTEQAISPARIDLGVHYQARCGDATALKTAALTGLTATKIESWDFSFDVCFVVPYNSGVLASPATDYSPILKFDILAS